MSSFTHQLRHLGTRAEEGLFDVFRNVRTGGAVSLDRLTLVGSGKTGFDYLPARPRNVRRALSDLPVDNPAKYTFVDLGSGKGRILFLAAEFPFRRIQGIEFAVELHREAEE